MLLLAAYDVSSCFALRMIELTKNISGLNRPLLINRKTETWQMTANCKSSVTEASYWVVQGQCPKILISSGYLGSCLDSFEVCTGSASLQPVPYSPVPYSLSLIQFIQAVNPRLSYICILTSVRGMQIPCRYPTGVRGMQVPCRYPDQCQRYISKFADLPECLVFCFLLVLNSLSGMEHHEWVSINAPPHTEVFLCFELCPPVYTQT